MFTRLIKVFWNVFVKIILTIYVNMEGFVETYLTHDFDNQEPKDIPDTNEPVWILGKKFSAKDELELIRREVQSIIWCTYRRGFVPIGEPGLTTDKGWGCMLRCGQMVLAQALINLHLGRDWYWTPETKDPTYLQIVTRFEEKRQAPFSIHQIALMGASEGKEVGEWFGPNTVAQVLKKLLIYDAWSDLVIHVALDNMVVKNDILDLCSSEASWKPLFLIIPLRLGLNTVNPIYVDNLKTCLSLPQSLGIIGGKTNQALYLFGYVGDDILYLDPHTTQKSGSIENKLTEEQQEMDNSYHCKYASRMPILNMDPSVAVCFLCTNQTDFDSLCKDIQNDVREYGQQSLFEICDNKPEEWVESNKSLESGNDHENINSFIKVSRNLDSEDEFELLG
ncbi:cysteine protease ATG4B [Ctenocephalides felis]|uniref:cysteine protease ATG4B n=1 Tax=Ctenocephalides felis TaxID=7515 RepID=UPI000E6E4421|nr:cysteine protease ATG4B [Ctenocephalides felis]